MRAKCERACNHVGCPTNVGVGIMPCGANAGVIEKIQCKTLLVVGTIEMVRLIQRCVSAGKAILS